MRTYWLCLALVILATTDAGAAEPPARRPAAKPAADAPAPAVVSRVRFFPAPGREQAMLGGRISGSNVSATDGFVELAVIRQAPQPGQWNELTLAGTKAYRWIRYDAPPGSHGNVAEIEFYAGDRRLKGPGFGSFGNRKNHTWHLALDGKTETWFDSDTADDQYVGLDLGEAATARRPEMSPPAGQHAGPVKVVLKSPTPGAVVRYTLDGTDPGPDCGLIYRQPIAVGKTTTFSAVACQEGLAPSPVACGTYLIGPSARPGYSTFHIGNSLTDITGALEMYVRTSGYPHTYTRYTVPGAPTGWLWNVDVLKLKDRWKKTLAGLKQIDHFTVQPRDFNLANEAKYDVLFFDTIRAKSPQFQPWLYVEWTERNRPRPSDQGTIQPCRQMCQQWPAVSWQESMAGMLLYVEELQQTVLAAYSHEGKRPRVLPSAVALGWIKNRIDHGQMPGMPPGSFYPSLFGDDVHLNAKGSYLIDLTWFSAFYGESPEGKVLPIRTGLSTEQAAIFQKLAWDVVSNYPDCGIFQEGQTPVAPPQCTPAPGPVPAVTPVTLSSATPGAWFRYTLDGTPPTRTRGYLYCGVLHVRPGMTLKAMAFKNGMADSAVVEVRYPAAPPRRLLAYDGFDQKAGEIHAALGGSGFGDNPWRCGETDAKHARLTLAAEKPLAITGLKATPGYLVSENQQWGRAGRQLDLSVTGPLAAYLCDNRTRPPKKTNWDPHTISVGPAGTTLWLSVLIRRNADTDASSDISLGSHRGPYVANPGAIAAGYFDRTCNTREGTAVKRWWALRVGESVTRSDVPIEPGKAALLVLRVDFGKPTRLALYVNPVPGRPCPSAPNAVATAAENPEWCSISLGGSAKADFDEVRIGESFEAVTPTP